MGQTLYASFADSAQAEKAAGALLDYGIRKEDISVVVDETWDDTNEGGADAADRSAKEGISTTTAEDAGAGAAKGAGIGLGVGVLAGLASIFIPGFGLVYGAGALATAIGGAVGATAAGAVAGGVTGYLKDQGIPHDVAESYQENLNNGGAMLEVVLPSGKVDEATGREIVAKYGGIDTDVYVTSGIYQTTSV